MNRREQVLLEWKIYLAFRQPKKACAVIAAVLAASLLVWITSHSPLLAVLCLLLLVAAVSEFLLPIHYRLTERGAHMRNFLAVRSLPWEQVRRCCRGPQGIKLSPLSYPSWREAFRGIHLWIEGEEQERAVEIIRALRPSQPEAAPIKAIAEETG
jgi:hypothetical protein